MIRTLSIIVIVVMLAGCTVSTSALKMCCGKDGNSGKLLGEARMAVKNNKVYFTMILQFINNKINLSEFYMIMAT